LLGAALADTPVAVTRGFLGASFFYYARLALNGHRALTEVGRALAATSSETVLDTGCGSGWFCQVVPGPYLGIDLESDYLDFARWRWGLSNRRFERMLLEDLPSDAQFDKAIMASVLHHLSDDLANTVLGTLARVVRRRLIVLDLDPDASRGIQTFFLNHDRGEHIRPPARQREILASHFKVVDQRSFPSSTHLAVHTLFTCEPR
jgi:SAM-dependent methyltransferase